MAVFAYACSTANCPETCTACNSTLRWLTTRLPHFGPLPHAAPTVSSTYTVDDALNNCRTWDPFHWLMLVYCGLSWMCDVSTGSGQAGIVVGVPQQLSSVPRLEPPSPPPTLH